MGSGVGEGKEKDQFRGNSENEREETLHDVITEHFSGTDRHEFPGCRGHQLSTRAERDITAGKSRQPHWSQPPLRGGEKETHHADCLTHMFYAYTTEAGAQSGEECPLRGAGSSHDNEHIQSNRHRQAQPNLDNCLLKPFPGGLDCLPLTVKTNHHKWMDRM